ncbi:MAG: VWA domain-containing protein [Candidatus Sulfopaludibacter sp.]|nr:VWA domain-containing protein [Candidatus Sulfopaludibacter sp.]
MGTPIWDTIFHIARPKLSGAQGRKAIVVFTDGYDLRSSFHGLSSAIEAVEAAGITVYTVKYRGRCAPTGRQGALAWKLPDPGMKEIAEATGGREFKQPDHLDAVCRQIEDDLRNQYVLAYTPKELATHGSWHRLNVQIARPRLKVLVPARYRAVKAQRDSPLAQ